MTGVWLSMVAFVFSVGLTEIIRRYAIYHDLLDHPNARSSHSIPTPRGGGLAIVIVFLLALVACWTEGLTSDRLLLALGLGGSIVAVIGFWDDHIHISAIWRLVTHTVAVAIALLALPSLPEVVFSPTLVLLGTPAIVLFATGMVWQLNLFNFMDGIDGLASIETITVAVSAAFILWLGDKPDTVILLIILAATTAGFLVWNWPPAKIFMGDVSSGFLGFVLAVLALESSLTGAINVWCWLILLGVFLADASITLLYRIRSGQIWYQAHRSHAYQHAAQLTGSHAKVTITIAIINLAWLFPIAISAAIRPDVGVYLTLLAYAPLFALAVRLRAGLQEA